MTLPHPGEFSRLSVEDGHLRLPPAGAGQRVGLFGGSFNPPHSGHRHVALTGLVRLALDRVWWMVTPGNPLKSNGGLPSLQRRIALTEDHAAHPRMTVTAFEAAIGTRYSAEAIAYARARYPGVRFVWLMGADNLATLHRWQRWRDIMRQVPVAVVDRPGASRTVNSAPAAIAFGKARVREQDAPRLADMPPPAWVFLHGRLDPTSSTRLRTADDGGL